MFRNAIALRNLNAYYFNKNVPLFTFSNQYRYKVNHKLLPAVSVKFFNTTNNNQLKLHFEKENNYAYEIIKKVSANNKDILKRGTNISERNKFNNFLNQSWENVDNEDLVETFVEVTNYSSENNICMSDPIFNKLIEEILRRCRVLSDEQVFTLLQTLKQWPEAESINSANYGDLWSALDDMCIERYRTWNVDKLLMCAELWYKLHLGKICEYMKLSLDRIARKPSKLNPKQIVQLMFYVNVVRRPLENMYDFEYRISQCINEFTVDELAVIGMAYFKTQTTIKDVNVLLECIKRIKLEITTIHEISLSALMKIIRYSNHLPIADQIYDLLSDLINQIDRLSLLSCLHIALVGTNSLIFHPDILNRIANKFVDNIQKARLKDIERIAFVTSLYDFNPATKQNFYDLVLQELRRRTEEIEKYPRCLTSCLNYLTLKEIYPTDLIEKVLSAAFLKHTYGKNMIGREVFHLDTCVKIDVPNYQGPILTDKKRLILAKHYTLYAPEVGRRLSATDKILLEIQECTARILKGNHNVQFQHILPHFERPDIVFALRSINKKAVDISNVFVNYSLSDIKFPPKNSNDLKWYIIVIGGWNNLIRNNNQPLGTLKMKLRQLEKIGYRPILVFWSDWVKMPYDSKIEYLKNNIPELLKNERM